MSTQNPQITLRVSQDLYDWLDRRFRASKDRHLSDTVRQVIEAGRRAIEANDQPAP